MNLSLENVKKLVRDVPDFPKKGIVFKDITPALASPGVLGLICDELARPFQGRGIEKVFAIESRGFLFGCGIAERLGAGVVPVRKAGKLPWDTLKQSYALEYGEAALEIHKDAIRPNEKVLLVDDILATGGTLAAARRLAETLDGQVLGAACFIELSFLNGRNALKSLEMHSLWSV